MAASGDPTAVWEARLVQLAIDEIPEASVMVFDTDMRYRLVRGAALSKHGFRSEDLEGRLAAEALAPERWESYRPHYEAALAGHSTSVQVASPDGLANYMVRSSPLRDERGGIIGGVVISTDISEAVAANRALAQSENRFRLLAENASDVVFQTGPEGRIEWLSPSVTRVLGWQPEDLLGHVTLEYVHPDDMADAVARRSNVYAGGTASGHVFRFRRKSGDYRWVSLTGHAVMGPDGKVSSVVAGLRDVHEETLARFSLAASEELFRTAIESSLVGMAMTRLDGTFLMVNRALCQLLRRDREWMLRHGADDVIHPDDVAGVRAVRSELASGNASERTTHMRLVRSDGKIVYTRRSGALIRNAQGEPDCLVLQWEDLTSEQQAREKLAFQAFHDPLTGLRNRAWILDMLEVDLQSAHRGEGGLGLLFIDLDDFKLVNDSLGHAVGDEVLCAVAERIQHSLRPADHAGRFGGDEFIAVVTGVRDRAQLEQVAERISASVAQELDVAGHRLFPSVSIGMALSEPRARPADLLRDTDAALYQAKADGRGCYRFFDESMHAGAISRLTIEEELREGVLRGQFDVVFQPIVRLVDRAVVGHESVLRWNHPTRGLLGPADFLRVAEETGLIVAIGEQVLEVVCRKITALPDLPGPIGIHFSKVQLNRGDWLAKLTGTLQDHGIRPGRIVLDIPEATLAHLAESHRVELGKLGEFGVGIQVDDFGTGLASIRMLRSLPVTGLKLDPSFVAEITDDDSPVSVLASGLAGLVAGLDLIGIAEGVQTKMQAEALVAKGWAYAQGQYFGPPGPLPGDAGRAS